MATIYNSDLTKELVTGAKIQVMRDAVPNQIAEKVVPVMEVNPKLLKRVTLNKNFTAVNSTGGTIYMTPTNKDFFLTNVTLSYIKDATSTSTSTSITCTVDGTSNYIVYLPTLTLTAGQDSITIPLNPPVKIDRGTNISLVNTTNVANITATAGIQGYFDDTTLA